MYYICLCCRAYLQIWKEYYKTKDFISAVIPVSC